MKINITRKYYVELLKQESQYQNLLWKKSLILINEIKCVFSSYQIYKKSGYKIRKKEKTKSDVNTYKEVKLGRLHL